MFVFVIIVGVLGVVIGSFLNVVIYRLPNKQSIVSPRSHCSNCKTTLSPLDLMPILSYVLAKGKCRYCHQPFSIRYPLIELLNGILYILVFQFYGLSFTSLVVMILSSILICITFIDIDHKIIPNQLNLSIALLALANLALGLTTIKAVLWGSIYGGGFLLFIMLIGALFKVELMGMGDLKLMFVAGALIGPVAIIIAYIIGFTIAGIFVSVLLLLKLKKVQDAVAFGPFLSIGILLSVLFYPVIINYMI